MMLSTAVPVTATTEPKTASHPLTTGNTLYVGGLGPNNYTKIQDAINDSHDYDTVFVYDDSSPYYENLIIPRSITLKGEDKNTTIIDGRNGRNVIYINYSNVTIQEFTIQHESETSDWPGIWIIGNDCTIEGNIIQKNQAGIFIGNGPGHTINPKRHQILNNIIRNNHHAGIHGGIGGLNFTISGNIIEENGNSGIIISNYLTAGNLIIHNIITNNGKYGIILDGTFNTITENTIQNHVHGKFRGTGIWLIGVYGSYDNRITRNNLLNNTIQGMQKKTGNLADLFTLLKLNNVWDENYWGESLSEPVRIPGLFIGWWSIHRGALRGISFNVFLFPWPAFDSHPAQEPYDIPSIGV
jgi:parallel beta-helix repeat protein